MTWAGPELENLVPKGVLVVTGGYNPKIQSGTFTLRSPQCHHPHRHLPNIHCTSDFSNIISLHPKETTENCLKICVHVCMCAAGEFELTLLPFVLEFQSVCVGAV